MECLKLSHQFQMVELLRTVNSMSNKHFGQLPNSVVEKFSVTKENYSPDDFKVDIIVPREEKFDDYFHLYCRLFEESVLKSIWEEHSEKLPTKVNIVALMNRWDMLQLTWNKMDILGCLLPNDINHTVVINAKKLFAEI